MPTKITKTLLPLYLRVIYSLMILSLLLAGVGVKPVSAGSTHTISGNAGVAGATITYTGGSTTASGTGSYTVTVSHGSFVTVTPSKAGYTFSPSSRSYFYITSDQTNQNYTATPVTYTISGSAGTAGAGATITYTGGSTTANASTGNYTFTVAYGWTGTVTPSKSGYGFTPANRSYTNVTSNQTNQNYTAASTAPSISGNVGVGGAILSYTDGTPKTVTANSSGVYSFQVSSNWSGTVTPSKTGFSFVPGNRAYANLTSSQTAQDFTARPTVFKFASMGDGQAETAYFTATVNQIKTLNPQLVIYNGDLEDTGFDLTQINPMINALKTANLFNNTFLVRGNADDHVAGSAALWENYFETAPNIKVLPAYVTNKVAINSSSDQLTYSFEYGNSIFIGLDVPGDIDYMTQAEMDFLDARLTYAESQGLTHAFIFFHGPEYPVESVHSGCSARDDANCTPPSLMTIINNHPIVSATIHGHEHVLSWTHMDNSRVAGLTRSYEQFITSPSGSGTYNEYIFPDRVDYFYPDMESSQGFATISVDGLSFTYSIYKVGTSAPVWSHTFSKLNTAPTISNITDQSTNEDTSTDAIPFTVGDLETNPAYLNITTSSSNTTLVPVGNISLGGSGVNRTISIMPASNQSGSATITVTVNDGDGMGTTSDTFLLTVNSVNDAPVANAQSVSLSWNSFIDLTMTGMDVEGSLLTYSVVDNPLHGSLSGSGANQTYTPAANYSGTDSFTFKVNDGMLDSVPATVSINVTAHTISGNAGVAGAVLSYTDGTPKTVTADGAGLYSFQVPSDWSGEVTPSKAGYIFSPTSMTYVNVLADQTAQNFTTTGVVLTISGNAGLAGVTISYVDGTPKTVTSDGAGMYSFEVPYNWSGIVTPSKTGYGFRPATKTYTNLISNKFAQDYTTTTSRVYYVDKTNGACTDVGTVGSFAIPFCTIYRGAYLATAGQIVHVIHGTYAETVYPRNNGVAGSPITYWGDPGVTVTGQPGTPTVAYSGFALTGKSYIDIDGFNITQTSGKGIYTDVSDHITISNNHVSFAGATSQFHAYEQGIYLKATTNSTISGNTTDHNTCIGIRLLNNSNNNLVSNNTSFSNFSIVESDAAGIETTGSSYNTIINNVTYSNEDSGINIYVNSSTGVQSTYNLVIGNLSYENGDHGIDTNNSPYNTYIGNTVHGNGTTGINVEGEASTGSHHTTLINNISAGNGFTPPSGSFAGNLRVDSASIAGTTTDYNLFNREAAPVQIIWNDINYLSLAAFQAAVPTQEVHGLEGDPRFVNPVPSVLRQTGVHYVGLAIFGNYYPNPGSPAIDSANADAPNQPAFDIDGNSRVDDPATPDTGAGARSFDDRGAYEFLPLGQSLPIVTTQAVTAITNTTATGNGTVTATGEPNPTQHGVVWNTTGSPTTGDSKTLDGAVSATGAFTSAMTGLTPGTLYHVRSYVTNAVGTVYGDDVTFTTLIAPTVTTQAVNNITTTTATGNGNITALGVPNPTEHGVVWATTTDPTIADSKTTDGSVSATGAYTSQITGLTPGTLYHVRAYATNAAGTSYGDDVIFTAHHVPSVTTQAVTAITTTTATGNGNVTALGVPDPSQHGVVWSTNVDPTIADSKTTDGVVSVTGAFTSSMTGLMPGTLYHVRAYATNAAGTVYGEDLTFTTLLAPTVITQAVTNITTTTATGNGNITVLGTFNPIEHGVVWATTANPTTANFKTTDGGVDATGVFTSSITGLVPGTLYHIRAYATSAAGTSYGEDLTFTALIAPTVTTQAVSSIGTTSAIGNGNITALGVPNPSQHGVVWATTANPTITDSKTTDGDVTATGAFTSSITGLMPGMLYYVRAYATNTVSTSYGDDVTFTTLPSTTGTTTSATNPGTGINITGTGTADWANPGYITADDTNYASATLTGSILSSGLLEGTNYGFAIPADAAIDGIVVTIGRHESGTRTGYFDVRDNVVRLLKAGVLTGNNKAATGTEWPTAAAVPASYGTTADLWGTTWTPAEINANNFGVALSVISDVNRIAYVDYIQISVTYTVTMVGSNTTVNCGSGSPLVTYGSDITCVATVVRGSGTKTPTGNVSWATNASGSFVTSPCTLSGSDGTTTCSVTYSPTSVGSGSHLITATYAGDPNFFTSNGNQTVTVNKKVASVMPNVASKGFGEDDPASFTGMLSGFLFTDGVSATYSRVPGETVAGSPYTISATLTPAGVLANYDITYDTAAFTITAKPITITPDADQTKVFGTSDPLPFTYTHTALLGTDSISGTLGRVAGEDVNTYAYTLGSLDAGTNYTLAIASSPATFSITAKPITVTADTGQSKIFGEVDPTFTFTSSDLVAVFTGVLDRVAGEDVGAYAIGQGTLEVVGSNYSMSFVSKDFSISAKPITITPDADQTKVFGASDPLPFTYAHTELEDTDSISGTLGRVAGENVNTYAYTLGSLSAGTNYTLAIASSPATFSITAKPITVTADTGQSKIFGAADPTFTYTSSDPVVVFTGVLDRVAGEDVGAYAIGQGTLAVVGSNYIMSFVSKDFAITVKSVTVTLSNLNQTYDGTPKSVTVTTVPAAVPVDVTYEGSSTAPTAVGNYAVVATVTDPNYSGTASGTLVIAPATVTQSISLVPGWNLISFNVHPANTNIATVLSSITGNYNLVYAWDATGAHSSSGNWVRYSPPPALPIGNTLQNLDETMGFWIRMTAADTLEVTGTVPTTTNINLSVNAGGWNLVSYPSVAALLLPDALNNNGVGTDYSLVYAFHANDIADPWKLFNRTGYIFANDLKQLTPGWGYWIKVTANHTWGIVYQAE